MASKKIPVEPTPTRAPRRTQMEVQAAIAAAVKILRQKLQKTPKTFRELVVIVGGLPDDVAAAVKILRTPDEKTGKTAIVMSGEKRTAKYARA